MSIAAGSTIGVLGGGQLAWMLGLEADRMGYHIAVLDADPSCPAARIARTVVTGALTDRDAALELARQSQVLTCDTEHMPADVLEALEAHAPVRPRPEILRTVQDRLVQRRFLSSCNVPQPRLVGIENDAELSAAQREMPFPAILKSRRSGYDGKGQARVARAEELPQAWQSIGRVPAVLEAFVPFDREISVLLARDVNGNVRFYPLVENQHRSGILRISRAPAAVSPQIEQQAQQIGASVAQQLQHVGVLAVELFVVGEQLLVNELAPRVHNSGHYTFGGCVTSQFEQHLRAICGLPLGDPTLLQPTVMLNLLGEAFLQHDAVTRIQREWPEARLFLYGKARANPGRKMAHVLFLGPDAPQNLQRAEALAQALHA